jgi:SAM-dependent methyltransferase
MAVSHPHPPDGTGPLDYLCVEDFIKTMADGRALETAFELGIIDRLAEERVCRLEDLQQEVVCDSRALHTLLHLLAANRVVEESGGKITLTPHFRNALRYRDLLETKLWFSNFVAPDFAEQFTTWVRSPARFAGKARVFDLFAYNRCFENTPENYERTKRWVRITTSLTRHEAQVCAHYHDFSPYERLLDIGGNSGEFALQLCRKHPDLSATVLDLPLVCRIGQEHVRPQPEAGRIRFVTANALSDPLPRGFDLVTFKSVLHDWPPEEAARLLLQGAQSLQPGGTLLIFERGPLEIRETGLPYSMIPFLLFSHSFRSPAVYEDQLKALGFQDTRVQRVDLETPFFLVTAIKTVR